MNTYKVCLIGDGGVGKTAYVKLLMTSIFEKKYVATLGVEAHPIRFDAIGNDGNTQQNICFNVWDCAGQEKFGGLRDGYYIQSRACIVMYDRSSSFTFKNVINKWLRDYIRVCPNTPIIVCGNKCDKPNETRDHLRQLSRFVSMYQDARDQPLDITYVDMSVKSCYNYDVPFKILARKLEGDNTLDFR